MNYTGKFFLILAIQIIIGRVSGNKTKSVRPKVVEGYSVAIRDVPFLLALHIKDEGVWCGAVIVSAWWALSAHHCVHWHYPEPENYYVRAGSARHNTGGQIRQVKKIYFYDPEYHYDGSSIPPHDIMLLRMSRKFRFSDTVRPAKLPVGSSSPKLLRVFGWGTTGEVMYSAHNSAYVLAANVTRVKWKDCVETSPWYISIVDDKKHLCYGEGGSDACHGDSGGPLADSRTVYGIVSFGDGCGIVPGVYAKVSFYRRWINRIMRT